MTVRNRKVRRMLPPSTWVNRNLKNPTLLMRGGPLVCVPCMSSNRHLASLMIQSASAGCASTRLEAGPISSDTVLFYDAVLLEVRLCVQAAQRNGRRQASGGSAPLCVLQKDAESTSVSGHSSAVNHVYAHILSNWLEPVRIDKYHPAACRAWVRACNLSQGSAVIHVYAQILSY